VVRDQTIHPVASSSGDIGATTVLHVPRGCHPRVSLGPHEHPPAEGGRVAATASATTAIRLASCVPLARRKCTGTSARAGMGKMAARTKKRPGHRRDPGAP